MTELRWKIIVVSIIVMVKFVSVECLKNTTDEALDDQNCINSSTSEFPDDLFTLKQKKNGAIILHFVMAFYCFTIVAIVCNDYFLPSVDCICTDLNLTQDVAGATFMAIATSTPELFTNIIGTFITESDLGVGTVVGSAVFNTLGVAACLGLAASKIIHLEWWPLIRDSGIYIITIGALTAVTLDEKVEWYEAVILLLMYIAYFLIMWGNRHLMKLAKKLEVKLIGSKTVLNDTENDSSEVYSSVGPGIYRWYLHGDFTISNKITSDEPVKSPEQQRKGRLMCPPVGGLLKQVWTVFSWPVSLIVFISIPDCRKNHLRQLYPLTFIMCIVWIGTASYLNAWMMTVIGTTFAVPDSVMGMTLLAAGGSLPEACSSVIMARKGIGALSISGSIGANTLDILLCLGMPWFIKCIIQIIRTGDTSSSSVNIISEGVTYNCFALLACALLLLAVIAIFRFQIRKSLGFTCLILYIIFITFSILIELNVFFFVNEPLCAEL